VGLAVVDVEVQRALRSEQVARAGEPGREKREVVAELVVVAERAQQRRAVTTALKPDPVAVGVGGHGERVPGLGPPCVERGVHVHEIERAVRQGRHHRCVIADDHEVIVEARRLVGGLQAHGENRPY